MGREYRQLVDSAEVARGRLRLHCLQLALVERPYVLGV
jgi:hypothetical protein